MTVHTVAGQAFALLLLPGLALAEPPTPVRPPPALPGDPPSAPATPDTTATPTATPQSSGAPSAPTAAPATPAGGESTAAEVPKPQPEGPTPPAEAPATATVPAQPQAPASAPLAADKPKADRVWVHFGANYEGALLEGRSIIDGDAWRSLCAAPCKRYVDIGGLEVRVSAEGMTQSNTFRLNSGRGRAQFRVSGGSDTVKTVGIYSLAAGIPLALGGMAMFGYGGFKEKDTLQAAGAVTLAVGATAIAVSIPLLLMGTTRVYNSDSERIAAVPGLRF